MVDTGMEKIDFRPTATAMAALLAGIRDDQLSGPTPCPAYDVADLAEHVAGLTVAFAYAARKEAPPGEMRDGDGSQLTDDWRERTAAELDALATAWADPAAYDGTTMAGPVELPAVEAPLVALDELVVHGWDLAVATGQTWRPDADAVQHCLAFVAAFDAPANDDGGLFGPPVSPTPDATGMERLAALTGRDPAWRPAVSH